MKTRKKVFFCVAGIVFCLAVIVSVFFCQREDSTQLQYTLVRDRAFLTTETSLFKDNGEAWKGIYASRSGTAVLSLEEDTALVYRCEEFSEKLDRGVDEYGCRLSFNGEGAVWFKGAELWYYFKGTQKLRLAEKCALAPNVRPILSEDGKSVAWLEHDAWQLGVPKEEQFVEVCVYSDGKITKTPVPFSRNKELYTVSNRGEVFYWAFDKETSEKYYYAIAGGSAKKIMSLTEYDGEVYCNWTQDEFLLLQYAYGLWYYDFSMKEFQCICADCRPEILLPDIESYNGFYDKYIDGSYGPDCTAYHINTLKGILVSVRQPATGKDSMTKILRWNGGKHFTKLAEGGNIVASTAKVSNDYETIFYARDNGYSHDWYVRDCAAPTTSEVLVGQIGTSDCELLYCKNGIVIYEGNGNLFLYDEGKKETRQLAKAAKNYLVLKGGSEIFYDKEEKIYRVNVQTGETEQIAEGVILKNYDYWNENGFIFWSPDYRNCKWSEEGITKLW